MMALLKKFAYFVNIENVKISQFDDLRKRHGETVKVPDGIGKSIRGNLASEMGAGEIYQYITNHLPDSLGSAEESFTSIKTS